MFREIKNNENKPIEISMGIYEFDILVMSKSLKTGKPRIVIENLTLWDLDDLARELKEQGQKLRNQVAPIILKWDLEKQMNNK